MSRAPPTSTLFPYTTLFRSSPGHGRRRGSRHRALLARVGSRGARPLGRGGVPRVAPERGRGGDPELVLLRPRPVDGLGRVGQDRKSTRLNSSHTVISYAVFC